MEIKAINESTEVYGDVNGINYSIISGDDTGWDHKVYIRDGKKILRVKPFVDTNIDEIKKWAENEISTYGKNENGKWDKDRVSYLVRYYLDRANVPVNALIKLVQTDMEKEGSKLPTNISELHDEVYKVKAQCEDDDAFWYDADFNADEHIYDDSDDDFTDEEMANILGGERTSCPECGSNKYYDGHCYACGDPEEIDESINEGWTMSISDATKDLSDADKEGFYKVMDNITCNPATASLEELENEVREIANRYTDGNASPEYEGEEFANIEYAGTPIYNAILKLYGRDKKINESIDEYSAEFGYRELLDDIEKLEETFPEFTFEIKPHDAEEFDWNQDIVEVDIICNDLFDFIDGDGLFDGTIATVECMDGTNNFDVYSTIEGIEATLDNYAKSTDLLEKINDKENGGEIIKEIKRILADCGITLGNTDAYGRGNTSVSEIKFEEHPHWYGWFNDLFEYGSIYVEDKSDAHLLDPVEQAFIDDEDPYWRTERITQFGRLPGLRICYDTVTPQETKAKADANLLNGGRMSDSLEQETDKEILSEDINEDKQQIINLVKDMNSEGVLFDFCNTFNEFKKFLNNKVNATEELYNFFIKTREPYLTDYLKSQEGSTPIK